MKLLHVDSSISGGQSVSRQIAASVVARLTELVPSIDVTYRDVVAKPVPHHTEALQNLRTGGAFSAGSPTYADDDQLDATDSTDGAADGFVNSQIQEDFATINEVLTEFLAADIVVLGAPMYNLGIPSQLKAWIDCLAAPGQTFDFTETGSIGLCGAKRVVVASSRGGMYGAQSPRAALDHQEQYLTSFFGHLGVTDMTFIRAEGVNFGPEQRDLALQAALKQAADLKAA